jgi:hypothetical protein
VPSEHNLARSSIRWLLNLASPMSHSTQTSSHLPSTIVTSPHGPLVSFTNILASAAPSHTPLTTAKSGKDRRVGLLNLSLEVNVLVGASVLVASSAPSVLLTIGDDPSTGASLVSSLTVAPGPPCSSSIVANVSLSSGWGVPYVRDKEGVGTLAEVAVMTTEMPTLASGGLTLLAGHTLCAPMVRGGSP